jgi:RNA polymerase sigma factor (TIGR02999 family)
MNPQSNPHPDNEALTQLLVAWQDKTVRAHGPEFSEFMNAAYEQLRKIAQQRVSRAGAISVSPTELLHDAILSLANATQVAQWNNSAHFLATMSLRMRSLLVDHARERSAAKRGGDWAKVTLTEGQTPGGQDDALELLALDQAFRQLEAMDARSAQVMHLTYFAGMDRDQIAQMLEISIPTVDRDLKFGRAFTMDCMKGA